MKRTIVRCATVACRFVVLLYFITFTVAAQDDRVQVDGGIFPGANEQGTISQPFNTVTEGVNAASGGQIVSIAAGTYYDAITIAKPVTLIAHGGTATIIGREDLNFSVLAINLQGLESKHGADDVSWQERYGRIANWMATTKKIPDLIALQEVHGESGHVKQYDTLFTLVTKIREQTNVTYRIAYLIVRPVPQGLSTLWAGNALLYNPDRVTNRTENAPGYVPSNFDDQTVMGVHPGKSLPCQTPSATFAALCRLIDGDGLAWISSFRSSLDNRWKWGTVFARLELTSNPGSFIHIYNVHIDWHEPDPYNDQIKKLVREMEHLFGSARLYPPVMMGDFNRRYDEMPGLTSEGGIYEAFEIAGYVARDVIYVLIGKDTALRSKQRAHFEQLIAPEDVADPATGDVDPVTQEVSGCGGVGILWSDHCAIFVQFNSVSN